MQLINPNPKKDWSIGQDCFYCLRRSKQITKATIAGINPVTEKVHLYNSGYEYDFTYNMDCIFETQDDAMQALEEQLGMVPDMQPVVNPEAKTDWNIDQECFFIYTEDGFYQSSDLGERFIEDGFIDKGSVIGIDPMAARASIQVYISPAPNEEPLGDDDPDDDVLNEIKFISLVNMNCIFENEDDAKQALMNQTGKA